MAHSVQFILKAHHQGTTTKSEGQELKFYLLAQGTRERVLVLSVDANTVSTESYKLSVIKDTSLSLPFPSPPLVPPSHLYPRKA